MQSQLIPWDFKSHPADGAAWEQVVRPGAHGYEGEGPMGRRAVLWTGLPSSRLSVKVSSDREKLYY